MLACHRGSGEFLAAVKSGCSSGISVPSKAAFCLMVRAAAPVFPERAIPFASFGEFHFHALR